MNSDEIQLLRKAAERRHRDRVRDRIAESEEELRSDLAAIERVAKLQELPPVLRNIGAPPLIAASPEQRSFNHGGLQNLVRKAVASFSKPRFKAAEIEMQIRGSDSSVNGSLTPKAVSGVLKRLVALHEVKVHRQGKGRRATIFAKGGGDGEKS